MAFRLILKTDVPNYPLFLVTGMFPWTWLMNALVQSTGAYRGNPSLVRKVRLPRAILPLSTTVQHMVHFVFSLPILLAAVVLSTGQVHASWIVLVPIATAVELAIIYPLALMLAAFNAAVRDVEYLVAIVLQMLFFLTPIVYPMSAIPAAHRAYFNLNPATPMIAVWRRVLYDGVLDGPAVARCAVFALVASAAAYFVHRAIAPRVEGCCASSFDAGRGQVVSAARRAQRGAARRQASKARPLSPQWALRDVSFEVQCGEGFGVVGPNGSGKSTLLAILVGALRSDTGRVTVNARIASLLELGSGFHPELTGRQNVMLYASILGMRIREIRAAFDRIVEFSELEAAIDKPLRTYSTGMVTRLGFSTIINAPADLLVIDEVLAVGDIEFREKCRMFLKASGRGRYPRRRLARRRHRASHLRERHLSERGAGHQGRPERRRPGELPGHRDRSTRGAGTERGRENLVISLLMPTLARPGAARRFPRQRGGAPQPSRARRGRRNA